MIVVLTCGFQILELDRRRLLQFGELFQPRELVHALRLRRRAACPRCVPSVLLKRCGLVRHAHLLQSS